MSFATIRFGSLRQNVPIPRDNSVAWRETVGPAPYEFTLQFPLGAAFEMVQAYRDGALRGNVGQLTIGDDDGQVRSYTCYLRGLSPASDQNFQGFRFADIRWTWTRGWVSKLYNWRRRVGDRRIIQADAFDNQVIENEIKYHPHSLKDGEPWRALEILRDVLETVREVTGRSFVIEINAPGFQEPVLENLQVEGTPVQAIARVLQACPSLQIRLEDGNRVVVFSQLNGGERLVRSRQGPDVRGGGYPRLQDNRFERPRAVNILFTRECELRFDFISGDRNTVPPNTDTTLGMRNVLPLPDNDIEGLAQGTYVDINDDLFAKWGDLSVSNYGAVTDELIRELWPKPGWFDSVAQIAEIKGAIGRGQNDPAAQTAAIWGRRFNEIRANYRQTFAINPSWRDRILELRGNRVSILNTVTGTKAPAQCFQNYAVTVTDRAKFAANAGARQDLLGVINMEGYAADITQADPSPFTVSVVDSDQGIVRVNLTTDHTQYLESVYPSFVDGAPNFEAKQQAVPRLVDEYNEGSGFPFTSLTSDHKAAIILSAIPFAPNSLQRYHVVRIEANDPRLQERGVPAEAGENAFGPEVYVKASPALITARFAWLDEPDMQRAAEIMFGFRTLEAAEAAKQTEQYLTNPDDVEEVALAEAANQYTSFADRLEGALTANFDPNLRADGTIGTVDHVARGEGGVFTTVVYTGVAPTRRVDAIVSPETRAVIQRTVKDK